jgi:hypothetical protein
MNHKLHRKYRFSAAAMLQRWEILVGNNVQSMLNVIHNIKESLTGLPCHLIGGPT